MQQLPQSNFRAFPSSHREIAPPLSVTPCFPLSPASGNHQTTFCLNRYAYSRHFIEMKSYSVWFLVSGFFPEHIFETHPCGSMSQHFVPLCCYVVVQCTITFSSCWTSFSFFPGYKVQFVQNCLPLCQVKPLPLPLPPVAVYS